MTDQIPTCPWSDPEAIRVISLLIRWVNATKKGNADLLAELRPQLAEEGVSVSFSETPTSD